jgi:glyoxylase-like metal-dependent hydrolase (beta-lactamase superfamily II)
MRIRNLLIAAIGLLMLGASQGRQNSVRELAPGVFFWQGDRDQRAPANCVWVLFKDHVLVIDANFPWAAQEIMSEIRKTTSKPVRFVFDTHWHNDHTYGNCVYVDVGATLVSSQECAEELASRGVTGWKNWSETAHSLSGYRLELPTMTFSDKIVFDDGAMRVEISRVPPSHSKGDAIAYLPKQRILVTGDLCVNWAWGNNLGDSTANPENWIRVLDQISLWDVQTVVAGHGAPVDLPKLRQQREYLADMLAQVRAGLGAGKSADELAGSIDLSRHGTFGVNAAANATSIRAVYRYLKSRSNW